MSKEYATQQPSLLIVDDQHAVATALANRLTELGFVVTIAIFGAEALECVAETRPDLALIDWVLSDTNGEVLANQLRGRGIPVVMMSGFVDEYLPQGEVPFIAKPFDIAELHDIILTTLNETTESTSANESIARDE